MNGETSLSRLISTLSPALDEAPYAFAIVPPSHVIPDAFALIREDEGVTMIARVADLSRAGLTTSSEWARITLRVHSSLEAIGLTAAVSSALAAADISANMIAGVHHDHIFVPWDRRVDAMRCLTDLQGAA